MSINKYPDKMTYWKKGGLDMNNQPQWDGPHPADVRWENRQRLFWTEDGREQRSTSIIYTQEDILEIGDYVVYGESAELTPPVGSTEVKRPRRIRNLRGTRVEHRYMV